LRDCRQYSVDTIENVEKIELIKSYAFDDKGNLIKIVKTPYRPAGEIGDSTLAVLKYDKKNNLISRYNYKKYLSKDTLSEMSKVAYLYNTKGLLERQIGLSIVQKTKMYDTLFVIENTYNSKGLIETENTRNVEHWFMSTGLKKFTYDNSNRIKEIQYIATYGNLIDVSLGNFAVYYTYYGDSAHKEVQVFKLQPKENSTYREYTYSKDKNGKITKRVGTSISGEILLKDGNYILNPESKNATIYKTSIDYKYDKWGRIEKFIYYYNSEDGDWKYKGEYSRLFKYKDEKFYKLPTDEYIDVE
jgi:hypothetical protein